MTSHELLVCVSYFFGAVQGNTDELGRFQVERSKLKVTAKLNALFRRIAGSPSKTVFFLIFTVQEF